MEQIMYCIEMEIPDDRAIRAILKHNHRRMAAAIFKSLSQERLIVAPALISIEIPLIELYHKSAEMLSMVLDARVVREALLGIIKSLYKRLYRELEYMEPESIQLDDFFILNIAVTEFPFHIVNKVIQNPENGFPRILASEFTPPGALVFFKGEVAFDSNEIAHRSRTFRCMNDACANPNYYIFVNEHKYVVEITRRRIRRTADQQTCETCKSQMRAVLSSIQSRYSYIMSFGGSYLYFTTAQAIDEGVGAVVGYMARNARGRLYLESLGFFPWEALRYVPSIEVKERKIFPALLEQARGWIPFKKEHGSVDASLLVILNVFNVRITSSCWGSPISDIDTSLYDAKTDSASNDAMFENMLIRNLLNSAQMGQDCHGHDYTRGQPQSACLLGNEEIKMLIYTNDSEYIKAVAANIIKVRIVYTMEALRNCGSCLCIRSIKDRDRKALRRLATHIFCIIVDGTLMLSYKSIEQYSLPHRTWALDAEFIISLKDAYIYLRRIYKGRMEPLRLLNTAKSILSSLCSLTNGAFPRNDIVIAFKKYITDKILAAN